VLEERRYPHTKGRAMGSFKYPQANPKHYRMTKRSARTYTGT